MTTTVGIRELKARLSQYIREAKDGGDVIITDRGKQVARLIPMSSSLEERIRQAAAAGLVHWNGKKLSPSTEVLVEVRGDQSVAEMLLEDRE